MDSKGFGKKGEQSAASFLCGKGFTIIGRNIRMNHLYCYKGVPYMKYLQVKIFH